jgi:hypothetical protein
MRSSRVLRRRFTLALMVVASSSWPLVPSGRLLAQAPGGAAGATQATPAENPLQAPRLRIQFDEFKQLWDRQEVLVVDVRDEEAYLAGHIPSAVLMPLASLDAHAARLRAERRPIVIYCA